MKNIQVPIVVKMDAGVLGTDFCDVFVVDMTEQGLKDFLRKRKSAGEVADLHFLDEVLADHAESYGVYLEDDGYVDENNDLVDPEIWVEGLYDPEEHDMYRQGGGSFLEDNEVRFAYEMTAREGFYSK